MGGLWYSRNMVFFIEVKKVGQKYIVSGLIGGRTGENKHPSSQIQQNLKVSHEMYVKLFLTHLFFIMKKVYIYIVNNYVRVYSYQRNHHTDS